MLPSSLRVAATLRKRGRISSAATDRTASMAEAAKATVSSGEEDKVQAASMRMLASGFIPAPCAPRLVPRIFCDTRLGPGAQLTLAPDAAQHVSRALRLKAGDGLTVFDGRGGEYEAIIQRIDRDRVDVKLGAFRDIEREARFEIGLVQGLPE